MNEFFKALLNVGTAGVGSLIALLAKDHMDRGANARKSDTEELKKIQAIVTDALIVTLSSPDFHRRRPDFPLLHPGSSCSDVWWWVELAFKPCIESDFHLAPFRQLALASHIG